MVSAAAFVVMLVLVGTPALAESTSQALQKFGLVGGWSANCANNNWPRQVIESPTFGSPTITATARNVPDSKVIWQIESAERLTEDKLRLVRKLTSVNEQGQSLNLKRFEMEVETILIKKDGKIQAVQRGAFGNQSAPFDFETDNPPPKYSISDGVITAERSFSGIPSQRPAPFLEKCLN